MPNILINPNSGIIEFSTGVAGGAIFEQNITSGNRAVRFGYDNFGGINITSYVNITGSGFTSGQDRFSVDGTNGRLFSVTDNLSGSLFSVNDIAGLPIIEAFDDNTVVMGAYNRNDFVLTGNALGIGGLPNTGTQKLYVSGNTNIVGNITSSETISCAKLAAGLGASVGGSQSSVIGGRSNSASNDRSIAGGDGCSAAGVNSLALGNANSSSAGATVALGETTVANVNQAMSIGLSSRADRRALFAHAAGTFAANGDAQRIRAVLRCKTTDGTTSVEMALDGSTTYLTIPSGKIMYGEIYVVGVSSTGANVAIYRIVYAAKNVAGTSTEVFSSVISDAAAGTSLTITTQDTGDYISIKPIGVASQTWRWVAKVDMVEVAYGT